MSVRGTEVVIVGGGILGCTVAYYLTRARRHPHHRRERGHRQRSLRPGPRWPRSHGRCRHPRPRRASRPREPSTPRRPPRVDKGEDGAGQQLPPPLPPHGGPGGGRGPAPIRAHGVAAAAGLPRPMARCRRGPGFGAQPVARRRRRAPDRRCRHDGLRRTHGDARRGPEGARRPGGACPAAADRVDRRTASRASGLSTGSLSCDRLVLAPRALVRDAQGPPGRARAD